MILERDETPAQLGVQFAFREQGEILYTVQLDTRFWHALGRPDRLRALLSIPSGDVASVA